MRLGYLLCALAALPWFAGTAARAEDAGENAYQARQREALVQRAMERVRPDDPKFGGVDELVETLRAEHDAWAKMDEARVARADALVGDGSRPGLIREGATLFRWLLAPAPDGPSQVWLRDPEHPETRVPAGDITSNPVAIARFVEWDLDWQRQSDGTVPVDGLNALRAAQNRDPGSVSRPAELHRPLVRPGELKSVLSARWLTVRRAQRDARLSAWAQEGPSRGLEDENRVRAKAARLAAIEARAKAWRNDLAELDAALNEMATMEALLTREAGKRVVEVEVLQGKPDATEAGSATFEALAKHRFEQWVEQQELRLLYITVHRAVARKRFIRETLEILGSEELKASELFKRFENELVRIRRERQLQRIESDGFALRREKAAAEEAQAKATGDASARWGVRVRALTGLLALNDVVHRAVEMRQSLENRLRPVASADAPARGAASTIEAELEATTVANLDAKRMALIREHLADLDAGLVAQLYAVADERVHALEDIRRQATGVDALQDRFEAARAQAQEGLKTFVSAAKSAQPRRYADESEARTTFQPMLEADEAAFEPTRVGIEKLAELSTDQLAATRALRRALTQLGPRSFQIRVDRNLQTSELVKAWDDVGEAARKSERWITLQDTSNAWTYVRDNWWRLLLCALLVLAAVAGAHLLGRALGRYLDARAKQIPALLNGLSLDAEAEVARREQAEAAAEAEALKTAALREAAGEETPAATEEDGDASSGKSVQP